MANVKALIRKWEKRSGGSPASTTRAGDLSDPLKSDALVDPLATRGGAAPSPSTDEKGGDEKGGEQFTPEEKDAIASGATLEQIAAARALDASAARRQEEIGALAPGEFLPDEKDAIASGAEVDEVLAARPPLEAGGEEKSDEKRDEKG